ncbi:MAG: hypothetical protein WCX15_00105 [Bacilli bacterium]|jgi:hypothetical protein|nr:hypothetical protein [Mollicutes bacterium]
MDILLNQVLPITLYVLGSALLFVLILLVIRLIKVMKITEEVIKDVDGKVKSLNGVFHIIDITTDKLSGLTDKLVDGIGSLILKIFKKKKEEKEENE